jgi:hypothetical protein
MGTASAQTVPTVNRIIDEGMNRSQVMMTAHELVDGIGPRLSNSPAMRRAEQWAIDRLQSWGLSNVHREGFEFGRGWEIVSSSARLVSPRPRALTGIPVAWTPSTNGPIRAEIVVAPMEDEEDFDAYRGQLSGKIVLVSLPGTVEEPEDPVHERFTAEQLSALDRYSPPEYDPHAPDRRRQRIEWAYALDAFLAQEGALAWVRISQRDGMLVHGMGYTYQSGATPALPGLELAAEDYRLLARLARTGPAPVIEIDNNVRFDDSDSQAYNIIAEIPGTDPRAGYVMAGAHFDSWVAGDGAADNGAGSAAVMEAARILRTLGVRPRRTIRFALWAAEEQGILGSWAYIVRHIATRPPPEGDDGMPEQIGWLDRFPIERRPGYGDLKAYFNMDNGSGRLRGIYAEGNQAAMPLLRQWLEPFATMGAGTVVAAGSGRTDHVFMQAVGVPAFQFIQDRLDYRSRVHHTNADTLDHLNPADLRQASVVLAGVLLAAANSPETLPRMPVPERPLPTDPFAYRYPDESE